MTDLTKITINNQEYNKAALQESLAKRRIEFLKNNRIVDCYDFGSVVDGIPPQKLNFFKDDNGNIFVIPHYNAFIWGPETKEFHPPLIPFKDIEVLKINESGEIVLAFKILLDVTDNRTNVLKKMAAASAPTIFKGNGLRLSVTQEKINNNVHENFRQNPNDSSSFVSPEVNSWVNFFKNTSSGQIFAIPLKHNISFHQVARTLKNLEVLDENGKKFPFKITIPSRTPPEKIIGIIEKAKLKHEQAASRKKEKFDAEQERERVRKLAETQASAVGLKTSTVLELIALQTKLNNKGNPPTSEYLPSQGGSNNLDLAGRLMYIITDTTMTLEGKLKVAQGIKTEIQSQPFMKRSLALQNIASKLVSGLEQKIPPQEKSRHRQEGQM